MACSNPNDLRHSIGEPDSKEGCRMCCDGSCDYYKSDEEMCPNCTYTSKDETECIDAEMECKECYFNNDNYQVGERYFVNELPRTITGHSSCKIIEKCNQIKWCNGKTTINGHVFFCGKVGGKKLLEKVEDEKLVNKKPTPPKDNFWVDLFKGKKDD